MTAQNKLIKQIFQSTVGLFIFSFGVNITIQADIGLAPWECLSMGAAQRMGLSFGTATTILSILILGIDLLLKEKIGYGTILDACLVGKFVDFCSWTGLIPHSRSLPFSICMIVVGLFIMAYGQYFYMAAGLSCGPRDSLLVGIGKRFSRTPIGIVQTVVLGCALCCGWLLGGPVGIGTIISVLLMGTSLQIVCRLHHFEPRKVHHLNIPEASRLLTQK